MPKHERESNQRQDVNFCVVLTTDTDCLSARIMFSMAASFVDLFE